MSGEFLTKIKRIVADPTAGPALNDLLNAETGHLIAALSGDEFDANMAPSNEAVIVRLDRYVALTADLARAVALGVRWSGEMVGPIWPSLIERVVASVDRATGQSLWANISLYPGVVLIYASGIGALVGGRYENLRAVLLEPRLQHRREWRQAVELLHPAAVIEDRQARAAGLPNTFAPMSDRLSTDLRPLVADLIPDDAAFDRLFDRFECLLGLVHVDVTESTWAPTGRFVTDQTAAAADRAVEAEAREAGASWPLLAAGAFGGSSERLESSLVRWRTHVDAVRTQARFFRLR
jgi:hypothetical protein